MTKMGTKKKIAWILAFFVLMTAVEFWTGGQAFAAMTGTVSDGPLNVRSGAGTSYSKIGSLQKGNTVSIKATKKDSKGKKWYQISYQQKTGYVSAEYVTIKTGSGTVTYTKAKTGVIKDGPLNVRSGAGTKYASLGKLGKGKSVSLKGEKRDSNGEKWYRITFNSKTGYIHSDYVSIKSGGSSSGSSSKTPGTLTTYTSSKKGTVKRNGGLYMRSNAGASYRRIMTIKNGASVTVTGERKAANGIKWYHIKYDGKTGYSHGSYISLQTSASSGGGRAAIVKNGPLNVRSGAGTQYTKIGSLSKGESLIVEKKVTNAKGEIWYSFDYTYNKTGYVLGTYLSISSGSTPAGTDLSSAEFEDWMTDQGFPTSYKSKLRALHKKHPKWIFRAQDTDMTWSSMLKKEMRLGNNLVEPTSPSSWKSKASGAYKNGKYTVFDGRWNAASEAITKYYLDPRNFLNEDYIYQFMDHSFDAKSQTKNTIKSLVTKSPCFMNTTSYINSLYNAGSKARVNPNVITAMVIMEQGWKGGTGLISGKYPGYKGYYNHFNIGAYTTASMSSTERGLWWAKGAGSGDRSYGRPWNSIEKSLTGGADYYASNYTRKNQNTYYTKKFNVMNGLSSVATHEYMTNVSGAASEGKLLSYAYRKGADFPITFHIPVYKSMPSKACPRP